MVKNREIERALYYSPEVIERAYPPVEMKKWMSIERAIYKELGKMVIMPYPAQLDDGEIYFQIHLANPKSLGKTKRLIVRKGFRLPVDEEHFLMKYCNEVLGVVDVGLYQNLFHVCRKFVPELKLRKDEKPIHGILHLYYTFHESGPRRSLFLAGLDYLAANLDKIDDYNMLGTTPEEIFDGIPLECLEGLNDAWGIPLLKTRDSRALLREAYETNKEGVF